jgi:hypothetical protein
VRNRTAGQDGAAQTASRCTNGIRHDKQPGQRHLQRTSTDRIIPSRGFTRKGPGKPSEMTDAELVCLAVAQVLLPQPFALVLGQQAAVHLHL